MKNNDLALRLRLLLAAFRFAPRPWELSRNPYLLMSEAMEAMFGVAGNTKSWADLIEEIKRLRRDDKLIK